MRLEHLFSLAAIHDPSTGFHDIKPVPKFHPIPDIVLVLLLAALIAILLYAWQRYRKQHQDSQIPLPPPPAERALSALSKLEQEREDRAISVREVGTRISLVARGYLEEQLAISAREYTASEVNQALPKALKKSMPAAPGDTLNDIHLRSRSLLRACERLTFAENAEHIYPSDSSGVSELFRKTRELIKEIEFWLDKERERTKSIIEEGKKLDRRRSQSR